ncbi:MAG TPA: cation-translocating P-type ATPase [Anaerolineales bacterium]|nr:cation-translocating P-type ATPase [Anaerolineales bacterium]
MNLAKRKNENRQWHALEREELLRTLEASIDQGLSSHEAERRLQSAGPNQLEEAKPVTLWQMIWEQLNSFVVYLLIIASAISAVLSDYLEAGVILAIVVLNTILGVIQERRAEQALSALKKMAAPEAQAIRDGSRQTVPANQLVPGDLVLLETGYYVPADLRLFQTINLRIDESALTGESLPAQKDSSVRLRQDVPLGDRRNSAFMGTIVAYGRGKGIIVSTGMQTQIGKIAHMLQAVEEEKTPLQRQLDELGKTLGMAAIAICAVVFLVGWLRGNDPLEMFKIAVGLSIAAVPEGLPTVVTLSLALGMREMANRHALIRRLASVETLGSATVICTDKTGTLTQNQMTATQVWVDGYDFKIEKDGYEFQGERVDLKVYPGVLRTLWVAGLNNDGEVEQPIADDKEPFRLSGDPTETALLAASIKAGIDPLGQILAYPRVQEVPFDADRKRMLTIHELADPRHEDPSPFNGDHKSAYAVLVKGAPDVVLNLCQYYQQMDGTVAPLHPQGRQQILTANEAMTHHALRVLGHAYRLSPELPDVNDVQTLEKDLIFTGLVGMIDPPRPAVAPALARANRAGIRTIMITGDFPNTASAIARSIGLLSDQHKVMSGTELSRLDDATLKEEVKQTAVFARVAPEHKVRIVQALQGNGEVVAMTGDGVNDAPAIKQADIGIAMGISGTDVAKETADMVLTDDNYATIVSAVEQGRIIYSNIRKFVFFLISSNLAEIGIIFLSTLAGLPIPLTVIQILWLNLITDGAPALALAREKGDPDVMEQQPRKKSEPIINGTMRLGIAAQTVVQTAAVLAAFLLGLYWHLGEAIPEGSNAFLYLFQYDWTGVDVLTSQTMAFATLSLTQLFRAYTVRSEKASLFSIGIFSNRYMQLAVGASIILLLLVINVPFLQPVFNTHFLSLNEWIAVSALALVPAITEEMTKTYLRWHEARSTQEGIEKRYAQAR